MFLVVRDRPRPAAGTAPARPERACRSSTSSAASGDTLRRLRQHRTAFRFLLAYLVYMDAITTMTVFVAIYAHDTGGLDLVAHPGPVPRLATDGHPRRAGAGPTRRPHRVEDHAERVPGVVDGDPRAGGAGPQLAHVHRGGAPGRHRHRFAAVGQPHHDVAGLAPGAAGRVLRVLRGGRTGVGHRRDRCSSGPSRRSPATNASRSSPAGHDRRRLRAAPTGPRRRQLHSRRVRPRGRRDAALQREPPPRPPAGRHLLLERQDHGRGLVSGRAPRHPPTACATTPPTSTRSRSTRPTTGCPRSATPRCGSSARRPASPSTSRPSP